MLLIIGRAIHTKSSPINRTISHMLSDYNIQKIDNTKNDCLIMMNIALKHET